MSNINFNKCNFKDCTFNFNDSSNSNSTSTDVGSAVGVVLLGGLVAPVLLASAVPLLVLGAKVALTGVLLSSVTEVGATLIESKKENKLLNTATVKDVIDLEPLSVEDDVTKLSVVRTALVGRVD